MSMLWIVMSHTYTSATNVVGNATDMRKLGTRFTMQLVMQGGYAVDTFFFMSGFLVTYVTLKKLSKLKNYRSFSWIMFYIHRYWRLTPTYLVVILINLTMHSRATFGAMYFTAKKSVEDRQQENCLNYWWTNLLYINNLWPETLEETCLGFSWYLPVDMQFYIISPIFLVLLFRKRKAGVALVVASIAACSASQAYYAYFLGATPMVGFSESRKWNETMLKHPGGPRPFDHVYTRTWNRFNPYGVDTLAFSMYDAMKDSEGFYSADYPITEAESVLWYLTARLGWGLALGWVTFACTLGHGGPIGKILSWGAWEPLARLTYSTYLIHPLILDIFYWNLEAPITYTDVSMAYVFVGLAAISYTAAAVISLFVEMPLAALDKLLLSPPPRRPPVTAASPPNGDRL